MHFIQKKGQSLTKNVNEQSRAEVAYAKKWDKWSKGTSSNDKNVKF